MDLKFNNGKFKIVHFTDLHLGHSTEKDDNTLKVQNTVLSEEKPDLVIITGDLVSGFMWNKKDPNWFYEHWSKLIQPMVSHNVRWAIALGNHDIEADLNATEVILLDSSHELSMTQHGPTGIGGAGNYFLPIYNSSGHISRALWMFDSGHTGCMGVPGWGCIQTGQVSWYKEQSKKLTNESGHPIPGMAFFHIPLYEHLELWNSRPVFGMLAEEVGVCCSAVNTGMYSAMKEMDDIKHVFCGHDHNNDYYGNYYGVYLGYGRKTGYGAYGPPSGWQHGARVIEISESDHIEVNTWLRLEDKSIEIQKYIQPGLFAQWAGCCDMEGHGREPTYSSTLYLFLFNAAWVSMMLLCIWAGNQCYQKFKDRKTDFAY